MPVLVDEKLLDHAITLVANQNIIKFVAGGGTLQQLLKARPDIKVAWAARESAVVPGLLSRELSDAYILIADRLNEAELSNSALLFYHKAVLADSDNQIAWMNQGVFYLEQEKFIAALACFMKSSTLTAKVHIAKILNILGWHDQALVYLNSQSLTKDDNEIVCPVKAECFEAKGDYQNALLELNKILNNDCDQYIWHQYAQICVKTGSDSELIRALPHILPHWNFECVYKNLSEDCFSNVKDQDWLKKSLPKDGIYHLNKEKANRFLVTSLISHRQKPERISARINAFLLREAATIETLWHVIAEIDPETWKSYSLEQRLHPNLNRHEMVHRMAVFLEKYDGDARGLWSGVTRGEVLRRLEEIGFKEAVTDFIIRTLSESRETPEKKDKKWDTDRPLNRITARLILGADSLPDHKDVECAIRKHFRNVDDLLHHIGVKYCLVKKPWCDVCDLTAICRKYQNDGARDKRFWWSGSTPDEEEPYTYYFTIGEEVCLAGTSVHGTVTKKMQISEEEFINLESNENFPAETGSFYALIKDHPFVRNLNS
jgi:tetratricopeptide (TPR) repeat protein